MWGKNGNGHNPGKDGDHTVQEALCWFATGMTVGTALAMLFAPRSGKETRAAIAEGATHMRERAEDMAHQARDKAGDWQEQAHHAVVSLAEKAHLTKDRASSSIGTQ